MAAVDQAMVEDYGIDLIQMMENAGRALAALARDRFLDGDPEGKTMVVLAGPGGNGGGGLVAGRGLHGWGATIRTVLAHEPGFIYDNDLRHIEHLLLGDHLLGGVTRSVTRCP